ncbi:hypothetical protein JZ751_017921 [Albula glossodonta]|uniref:Uncharacterized protein n=1 Tax=Albula glossodonta TaxID=121402 RepID=A0A8T2PPR7_9TELE|nr:hypothetical protein JZ751_017921 [Albula glossodonta]
MVCWRRRGTVREGETTLLQVGGRRHFRLMNPDWTQGGKQRERKKTFFQLHNFHSPQSHSPPRREYNTGHHWLPVTMVSEAFYFHIFVLMPSLHHELALQRSCNISYSARSCVNSLILALTADSVASCFLFVSVGHRKWSERERKKRTQKKTQRSACSRRLLFLVNHAQANKKT